MLPILRTYNVPDRIVQAIGLMYNSTRVRALAPDEFELLADVLQGDTLAPFLFVIVLDYTMRQAIDGKEEELCFKQDRRRKRRQHPTVITDTDFTDGIS